MYFHRYSIYGKKQGTLSSQNTWCNTASRMSRAMEPGCSHAVSQLLRRAWRLMLTMLALCHITVIHNISIFHKWFFSIYFVKRGKKPKQMCTHVFPLPKVTLAFPFFFFLNQWCGWIPNDLPHLCAAVLVTLNKYWFHDSKTILSSPNL